MEKVTDCLQSERNPCVSTLCIFKLSLQFSEWQSQQPSSKNKQTEKQAPHTSLQMNWLSNSQKNTFFPSDLRLNSSPDPRLCSATTSRSQAPVRRSHSLTVPSSELDRTKPRQNCRHVTADWCLLGPEKYASLHRDPWPQPVVFTWAAFLLSGITLCILSYMSVSMCILI